jgi:hypothetical protein
MNYRANLDYAPPKVCRFTGWHSPVVRSYLQARASNQGRLEGIWIGATVTALLFTIRKPIGTLQKIAEREVREHFFKDPASDVAGR